MDFPWNLPFWGYPHDYGNPRESFVEASRRLVGGWATPLKNDGVRPWDDLLFPISGKSFHVPNHQPVYQFYHIFSLGHLRERAHNLWLQLTGSISPQEMAVEMSTSKNQPFLMGFSIKNHPAHGSLNVPIEHHPTIRYMVYNGYYKVMSNIPKMGQLPTPAAIGDFRIKGLRWTIETYWNCAVKYE